VGAAIVTYVDASPVLGVGNHIFDAVMLAMA
jgi:hypothetical protein